MIVVALTIAQTNFRIQKLTEALKSGRLSIEERWLVHQERAYLLSSLDEYSVAKPYSIPESIEKKITT